MHSSIWLPHNNPGSNHSELGAEDWAYLDNRLRGRYTTIMYTLLDQDGQPYASHTPGLFGGYRPGKLYGRLDCSSALHWIAKGHYVQHRVFFADEPTAVAAGYRPCAKCLPQQYQQWKSNHSTV